MLVEIGLLAGLLMSVLLAGMCFVAGYAHGVNYAIKRFAPEVEQPAAWKPTAAPIANENTANEHICCIHTYHCEDAPRVAASMGR